MAEKGEYRLPPGHQVYDAYNGARVGAIVGAVLGAILTAVTTPVVAVSIPVLGVLGGLAGYLWERRRIEDERSNLPPNPPGELPR
ncbi:MAG: hypothetical protein MUP76_00475 [Acidimicrobiia bacterium]|nr:hypothetical protein [Acidimicrobiia bacterium]